MTLKIIGTSHIAKESIQAVEKAFEELKTLNGKGSGVSQPASIRPAFTPSLPEKKKVNFILLDMDHLKLEQLGLKLNSEISMW